MERVDLLAAVTLGNYNTAISLTALAAVVGFIFGPFPERPKQMGRIDRI